MQTAVPADSVSPIALHTEAPPLTKQLHMGGNEGGGEGRITLAPVGRLASCIVSGRR